MPDFAERFRRLPAGAVGGGKLAARFDVNLDLAFAAAMDSAAVGRKLEKVFGPSDPPGDADFFYCVEDTTTGVRFPVYSAQSGPAYGGPRTHFASLRPLTLADEVRAVLADFDRALEAAG